KDDFSPARYYLARSTDEASTWPILYEIPHPGELRIDTSGNFYLMRSPDDAATKTCPKSSTETCSDTMLLSVSADQGRHWSQELNVRAPGLSYFEKEDTALYGATNGGWSCCTNWFYDVREPGHVAVAYSGYRGDTKDAGPLNGYVTETRDALD